MKTKHIIIATANLMIKVLNDHYVTFCQKNNKNVEVVAVYQSHTVLVFFS